jgi:hypothetical protein
MKGKSQAHHTSFLMLEAIKNNSNATLESSSISLSKTSVKSNLFFQLITHCDGRV